MCMVWASNRVTVAVARVTVRGGSRNLFWGAKPRSPIESKGRSPNRGRKAPEFRGRSPIRGREAPENWERSSNRGQSPRKSGGGGVWGSVSPSPENFWKIKLEIIHFGAYLKQLFDITNAMDNCPHSWQIISNYLMWQNYKKNLKYKTWQGSGGLRPPEAEAFLADKVVFFGAHFEQTFQINMQLNSFASMLPFQYVVNS